VGDWGCVTGGVARNQTGSVTGDLIAPQIVTCAEMLCPQLLSAGESTNPSHLAGQVRPKAAASTISSARQCNSIAPQSKC